MNRQEVLCLLCGTCKYESIKDCGNCPETKPDKKFEKMLGRFVKTATKAEA